MFNHYYIGRSAAGITIGQRAAPYTRVVVRDAEGQEYIAGDSTGQTLTVELPWGSQAIANRILAKFTGLSYQPYTADKALLPPEAGLGDVLSSAIVKGGIFRQVTDYGPLMATSVSSPESAELEHEFPYVSKIERESRRISGAVGGLRAKQKEQEGFNLNVTKQYNDLSGGLLSLGAEIDDHKAVTTQVFASIEDEFTNVDSRLRLTATKEDFALINGRLGSFEEASAALTARVTGAESALELVSSRIGDAEEASAALAARVGSAEASLELKASQSSVDGLSQSVATLQADLVNINGKVITLSGVFTVTDETITALRQFVAAQGLQIGKNYFYVASKKYEPQTITSTSGPVTVLGY